MHWPRLLAILLVLAVPASAAAHEELQSIEEVALGPEHAREHAVAREHAAQLDAMTPRERRHFEQAAEARERQAVESSRALVAGQPKNVIGEWSPRYGLPDYVMNAALLHTGEVAMWGWLPYEADGSRPLRGENWFWNTTKPLPGLTQRNAGAAFKRRDAPPITIDGQTQTPPLYCSGMSFLPDGRLVIAGGNRAFTDEDPQSGNGWKGLDTLFIYDPKTKTWTQGPTMQAGRWYPTQVMLPDGRTWIGGGYDESGFESYVDDQEILDVAASALSVLPSPAIDQDVWGDAGWPGLYPHAWVMPGGRLLVVPREWSRAVGRLDLHTMGWQADRLDPWTGRPEREGATGVLLPETPGPANSIMQIGGFAYYRDDGVTPDGVASPSSRTLDQRHLGRRSPWVTGPSLNVGRSYHNTVLLPGGGMVTVGGGAGTDPSTDPETSSGLYYTGGDRPELLNAELFNPVSRSWRLGAAQQSFRAYHSVALLLPDGRVWSAGDDWHEDVVSDQTGSPWRGNAEIYSPPYLFGGLDPATRRFDPNRPAQRTELVTTPAKMKWGEQAPVTTNSDDVSKVVIVAPGAATHSIDTNQRHVELEIVARTPGSGVTVRVPPNKSSAPKGWYMMFAVNGCGTPSHAKWIRIGPPLQPGPAPPAPPQPRLGAATCV